MRSNETNATTVATDYTSAGSLVVDDWFALEGGLSGMQSSGDSATLTSWLNGQMSFGGSRYVFLTARPDLTEIPVNAVAVLITGDSETDKPRLIITVQSEAPGIAAWRMEYFGSSANSGNAANDANPMGDGIPNLVKYALGLDPTVDYTGSPYAPYSEWQESNGFTYTFTYDPETDDVALVIEVTDDLLSETWADLDPFASSNQVSVLDDVPETGLQTITLKTTSLLTRPAS
jgi:hypothetical protein